MDLRTLLLRLGLSHPIAAFWLAGLARVAPDPELLGAALRLLPEECAMA